MQNSVKRIAADLPVESQGIAPLLNNSSRVRPNLNWIAQCECGLYTIPCEGLATARVTDRATGRTTGRATGRATDRATGRETGREMPCNGPRDGQDKGPPDGPRDACRATGMTRLTPCMTRHYMVYT